MANNNMTNDIVNDIAGLNNRISGLETEASDALSVARINKVYPRVALKMVVKVYKRQAQFPGVGKFPGIYMSGNTILTRD